MRKRGGGGVGRGSDTEQLGNVCYDILPSSLQRWPLSFCGDRGSRRRHRKFATRVCYSISVLSAESPPSFLPLSLLPPSLFLHPPLPPSPHTFPPNSQRPRTSSSSSQQIGRFEVCHYPPTRALWAAATRWRGQGSCLGYIVLSVSVLVPYRTGF